MNRPFGPEQRLLQRERKTAAGWLWGAAYATVLAIALAFLVALAWGVHRVSRPDRGPSSPRFARHGGRSISLTPREETRNTP